MTIKNFKIAKEILIIVTGLLVLKVLYNKHIEKNVYTSFNKELKDSLKQYKNKYNEEVSKISILEGSSNKQFVELASKDSQIIKLQQLVKENNKRIKHGGSVTNITNQTDISSLTPTIITEPDTVEVEHYTYIYPRYETTVNKDGWIVGKMIATKDSVELDVSINNEYNIIMGREGGFLRKKKPFIEITNKNPYTTTKTLRTYDVSAPKPKKIGIGLYGGYGVTIEKTPRLVPNVGIGLSYNLIRF